MGWFLFIIFQWVLLLAPAVVLRKYRCRPMSKGDAIGTSLAIGVFWVFVGVMITHELGIEPLMSGNPINTAPIAFAILISFWILRKATVLDGDTSLKMLDRVFKKIFPETDTPLPAQAQRGQHPEHGTEQEDDTVMDEPAMPTIKTNAPTSERSSTYTTPEIDEDLLYEQAFNELQGEERVVSTWSRAFAEAAGDEQKAKAL